MVFRLLLKKSAEFNIDSNATHNDRTAFHLSCQYGHSKVAEMLILKSVELNIKLNGKDYFGKTAFHLSCQNGHMKIAEMLIKKSVYLNIKLNDNDYFGKT